MCAVLKPSEEPADNEYILRFQNGDEGAFNALVRRYQEKVYWIARRFAGDHDSADDIAQEVFIKIYSALGSFRGESSFFTWLYRITVNIALNHLRKKRVKTVFRMEDVAEDEVTSTDDPTLNIEHRELEESLEMAIRRLPPKQRTVFVLRFFEELPYEEIASILKTSEGGLKANYFHALRKIQKYVKHDFPET